MNTPWEGPDDNHSAEEEAIADGMTYLMEQALYADLGFDENDPDVARRKVDAVMCLLSRIACELCVIRHRLTKDGEDDDPYDEPWK